MNVEKTKWMTVSRGSSLASEGISLFVDLWVRVRVRNVSETQNEIVVS